MSPSLHLPPPPRLGLPSRSSPPCDARDTGTPTTHRDHNRDATGRLPAPASASPPPCAMTRALTVEGERGAAWGPHSPSATKDHPGSVPQFPHLRHSPLSRGCLFAAGARNEARCQRGSCGIGVGDVTHARPPPNLWQRDGQPHARGLPDVSPWVDAGADGDRARGRSQPRCLPPAATQTRLINHRLWPPHTPGSARAGSGPALSGCSHPRARKVCPPPNLKQPPHP